MAMNQKHMVLDAIYNKPGLIASEYYKPMEMPSTRFSHCAASLEKAGMITVKQEDHRAPKIYFVTKKGEEAIKNPSHFFNQRHGGRQKGGPAKKADAAPQVVPKLNPSADAEELMGSIASVLKTNSELRDALVNIRLSVNQQVAHLLGEIDGEGSEGS